jgi:hypothetical protein
MGNLKMRLDGVRYANDIATLDAENTNLSILHLISISKQDHIVEIGSENDFYWNITWFLHRKLIGYILRD